MRVAAATEGGVPQPSGKRRSAGNRERVLKDLFTFN